MPHAEPILAFAALIGLAANFLGHLLASRLCGGQRRLLCLGLGFSAGLAATAVLTFWSLDALAAGWLDSAALAALNAITYLALAFGYFNFINLNIASLRIRILQEMLAAAPAGLTCDQILMRYDARELVENRIARLLRGKQIEQRDGRFYTRPSVLLLVARIMWLLKFLILGRRRQAKVDA